MLVIQLPHLRIYYDIVNNITLKKCEASKYVSMVYYNTGVVTIPINLPTYIKVKSIFYLFYNFLESYVGNTFL